MPLLRPQLKAKKSSGSKFTPAVGRYLDDDDVRQIDARDRFETARTSDRLAYIGVAVILVSLAGAAVYSFRTDSFAQLEHVWAIVAPFVGMIATSYFNRSRRDSG